jgi:hypothetical protein
VRARAPLRAGPSAEWKGLFFDLLYADLLRSPPALRALCSQVATSTKPAAPAILVTVFMPMNPMNLKTARLTFSKVHVTRACLVLALFVSGCGKPAPEAPKDTSQAKPAAQSSPSAEVAEMDVAAAAVRILNAAHRNGAVIVRGECQGGMADQYPLHAPVTLEPMDRALQEISAKYQNIYWRESPASGVRVVDSAAKARLLRVRVTEFRIVEDREPDGAMAALWRAPEVAGFLRKNHIRFARRPGTAKKAISPPMIIEMKKTTVADILDRIVAGYRADPPKVWTYRECGDKKETLLDVQMK